MRKTTAEQSSRVLKEAKKLLDELEIPFCLFLGTALGAYRDKAFCDGDEDDMDIAIDIKYFPRIQEIKDKFHLWANEHNWVADDGISPESAFLIRWGNGSYSKVDMFFISEVDGKSAWRFYPQDDANDNVTKLIDKKYFSKFDKITFYGEEYNIPCCIEEYLTDNYGDWKTPINRKFFNWQDGNKAEIL